MATNESGWNAERAALTTATSEQGMDIRYTSWMTEDALRSIQTWKSQIATGQATRNGSHASISDHNLNAQIATFTLAVENHGEHVLYGLFYDLKTLVQMYQEKIGRLEARIAELTQVRA